MKDYEVCDKLIKIIENGSFKRMVIAAEEIYAYKDEYSNYIKSCEILEKERKDYYLNVDKDKLKTSPHTNFKEVLILKIDDSQEWKDEVLWKLKFYISRRMFQIQYYVLDTNDNIINEEQTFTVEEIFDRFMLYSLY